jgi:hypothetical protein
MADELPVHDGLLAALRAARSEMPVLLKTETAKVQSQKGNYDYEYVDLAAVVENVDPVLARHGLVWTCKASSNERGPTLKYRMAHAPTGESDGDEMPLFMAKADAQGQGSALTYARRYALVTYLNIVVDADDDGARAVAATREEQTARKNLRGLLSENRLNGAQLRPLFEAAGVAIPYGGTVQTTIDTMSAAPCATVGQAIRDFKPAEEAGP